MKVIFNFLKKLKSKIFKPKPFILKGIVMEKSIIKDETLVTIKFDSLQMKLTSSIEQFDHPEILLFGQAVLVRLGSEETDDSSKIYIEKDLNVPQNLYLKKVKDTLDTIKTSK